MTCGRTERRGLLTRESPVPMSASAPMSPSVDPGWTGIIEVLVSGLGGTVRWEPGSVVLQLPDHPFDDRVGDLDGLRLCLGRIRVPVVFDTSRVTFPDASLVEFTKRLVESGLMVDVGCLAA